MLAFLRNPSIPLSQDWASLLLRVGFGGFMLINHGWPKFQSFAERSASFADPLGVGPTASLSLVILAEVFCSLLLIAGLATRLALIPLIIAMLVAALVVNWAEPLAKKEMALLYVFGFAAIFLLGSGRFSLDGWLARRSGVQVRGFQGDGTPRSPAEDLPEGTNPL